eukprot:TRINITY_DN8982_c0_g1_i2.p2 TRINITY_DN8982_c0_g1~~TRINITY_DN8982_c0_g1_i2.p2  ORF type:complete len:112 (+),score=13.64 TRINITY_DN8982_c0_g1_i2:629-964(+)
MAMCSLCNCCWQQKQMQQRRIQGCSRIANLTDFLTDCVNEPGNMSDDQLNMLGLELTTLQSPQRLSGGWVEEAYAYAGDGFHVGHRINAGTIMCVSYVKSAYSCMRYVFAI